MPQRIPQNSAQPPSDSFKPKSQQHHGMLHNLPQNICETSAYLRSTSFRCRSKIPATCCSDFFKHVKQQRHGMFCGLPQNPRVSLNVAMRGFTNRRRIFGLLIDPQRIPESLIKSCVFTALQTRSHRLFRQSPQISCSSFSGFL